MCGIIGYLGSKEACPLLIRGLERLEYRGYDSAGVATCANQVIHVIKAKGRVENIRQATLPGTIGIAHTRWSTHGAPSDRNSHPFVGGQQRFAIVHNGIIENYLDLKEELRQEGVSFSSDTDSEVIVHLIAKYYQQNHPHPMGSFRQAVLKAIARLQGAYAFCVMKNDSNELIGARNGSPLVVGIKDREYFLASDVSAIIEHTKKVVYLDDFQLAQVSPEGYAICNFQGEPQALPEKTISWDLEQAQKQGYKHFMLKEIMEQPQVVEEALRQAIAHPRPSRAIIVACGTASYAGLIGKYLLETIAKIPVVHEVASEFRYKEPLLEEGDVVIAISQSGETADTLAAIRLAKGQGISTLGIINVPDSTIAREAGQVIYTKAGPEIGVASTKAFIAQMLVMYQLAYHWAGQQFQGEGISHLLKKVLGSHEQIKAIAQKYAHCQNMLYIGRNSNYPLALEGALKLKEISYIHAEAYPAGELKHGPIALVSEDMPTFAICPQDSVYEKTMSNIEEIKARNGKVIALATEGDERLRRLCDDMLEVPKVDPLLYPLVCTIPLQLFAYYLADQRECDIDKPRNLAKSVTVE